MTPPGAAEEHARPPGTTTVRHPSRWLLRGARPASRWIVRRRCSVRLLHAGRMPARGPVILAANHVGIADGPMLAAFSPRPVHALTKHELFAHRGLGRFLLAAGQVPIDRFHVDARAVRTCLRVLREGGVIGIFPEGRRGAGDLSRFHRGAAYLALVTGAPVVPVVFLGTREPGGGAGALPPRGGHVDIVYGEPFRVARQDWPRTREQVAQVSLLLRERMLATLGEAVAETGRELPGPLPPGHLEDDPHTGVVEQGA